jgi:N-acetylglucosaminyl-diphospho-decaprenol L-rhamnosyltransferase
VSGRRAASAGGRAPDPDTRVGFVTVTYSPGSTLAGLLDSIPAACRNPGPVVIADNGSTDGSVEQAASRPGVSVLRTGGNIGYGAAANLGVAALDRDISMVLIANPDVVLRPGAVDELLAAAARHPQAGAIGPKITTGEGEVYPSARELPSIGRGIGHALTERWWPSNPWTRAYRRYDDVAVERRAGWLSGSCILVRRAAFEAIGGFDAGFFMYFEDVDLGERMSRAGWQNIYAPDAEVLHIGGHSTGRQHAAMIHAHHLSAYRYLAGRYPDPWHAPLRLLLRAGLRVRAEVTQWMARRRTRHG